VNMEKMNLAKNRDRINSYLIPPSYTPYGNKTGIIDNGIFFVCNGCDKPITTMDYTISCIAQERGIKYPIENVVIDFEIFNYNGDPYYMCPYCSMELDITEDQATDILNHNKMVMDRIKNDIVKQYIYPNMD